MTSMSYYFIHQNSNLSVVLLFFIVIALLSCSADQNSDLPITGSSIDVEWEVNSNFEPNNQMSATLTLINNGDDRLPASGWTLYFNSIRIPDLDSFPNEFSVSHINGYLFKLEPAAGFNHIEPGGQAEIPYKAAYFAIKESDAPEGFYFVFDDGTIETVQNVEIAPFDQPEQHHRTEDDNIPLPTAAPVYAQNDRLSLLPPDQTGKIIPSPRVLTPLEGRYIVPETLTLSFESATGEHSEFILELLADRLDRNIELQSGESSEEPANLQILRADDSLDSDEAYRLDINPDGITITANAPAGEFYAIQSLLAWLENSSETEEGVRTVSIEDQPAFSYRGMHMDVARNFHPADDVKRLLDIMAMYKLNTFHFHLTDDEGWRIAINTLPELTDVGGRRGHTETEEEYMIPVYGSGPDPTPGNSFGSGWYSQEEYIEILKYAADRHIEVIPEIDMPGHARAAILAMKARAARFLENGDADAAREFRLDEPEDRSSYRSVQNYTDNVVNVCNESVYRFLEVVIDDLADMHREAGVPLNSIHMGGDEVPHGAWEESPDCSTLMAEEGIDNVRDLQGYFFTRSADLLQQRNISMGGWEEVAFREQEDNLEINTDFTDRVIPYVWSNIWGGGTEDRAYRLANAGFPVVMSHASNLYFDLAYTKHWQDPGFYWAAMFTTEAPFSFQPFTLFQNASHTNYGNPLPENYFDGQERLEENARENILGLQGQLWTETVNEERRWEYMVLPRLLGLAERAWQGQPSWASQKDSTAQEEVRTQSWNEFANRLGQYELPRLDRLYSEINYRIPPPGAVIKNDTLHANISLPGLTIRYKLDGSDPTENSPQYNGPVDISENDRPRLAAFSLTGRPSRTVDAVKADTP